MAMATHDIVLQIEDDWVCTTCLYKTPSSIETVIEKSINIIESDQFSVVCLTSQPWQNNYIPGLTFVKDDIYKINKPEQTKWNKHGYGHYFSNRPHIKNKNIHKEIGPYFDNGTPGEVEVLISKTAIHSSKINCFCFKDTIFHHIGQTSLRNIDDPVGKKTWDALKD
jgi:hypothetical protein